MPHRIFKEHNSRSDENCSSHSRLYAALLADSRPCSSRMRLKAWLPVHTFISEDLVAVSYNNQHRQDTSHSGKGCSTLLQISIGNALLVSTYRATTVADAFLVPFHIGATTLLLPLNCHCAAYTPNQRYVIFTKEKQNPTLGPHSRTQLHSSTGAVHHLQPCAVVRQAMT